MKHILIGMGGTLLANNITVEVMGVPVNVLVACAAGTYASFAWGKPLETRGALLNLFACCVIMGAAFTAVANEALHFFVHLEMTTPLQVGVGTICSFAMRFVLPWLADQLKTGAWVKFIPWSKH